MHQAAEQALYCGGNPAGEGRKASQGIAVEAAGEPDRRSQERPADDSRQNGTDSAGIGNGVVDRKTEVGSQNGESRKNEIEKDLMLGPQRLSGEGAKGRGLAEEIGDDQKNGHLLEQGKK